MSAPIVVPDLVREVVQFILMVYPALEESLFYWTVSTTKTILGPAPIIKMLE